jgi:poly-gamma-glutamate capsule biosynthesis protein CapA/YwtB (metallophosphatase superfamily)
MLFFTLLFLTPACSKNQTPAEPEPTNVPSVRLAITDADVGLRERIRLTALALGAELQMDALVVESLGAGDGLLIDGAPRPDGKTQADVAYWGAFAGFWSARTSLDLAALTSPEAGAVVLPEEYRAALVQLLARPVIERATWMRAAQITAALQVRPEAIAFLPLQYAGPQLRSLEVDRVDLVRGEGDAAQSPLVQRVYLSWQDEEVGRFGQALAERLATAPPEPVRVIATGDIIPARCVYARQRAKNDYAAAFRPTAPYLAAADITLGSLDASISDAAEPIGCVENFNLMAPSRSIEGLKLAGYDVITVATNHIKDCGSLGFCGDRSFLDTLSNLEAAGIQPVGGGKDLASAHAPVYMTVKGVRFAFLGYDDVADDVFGATQNTAGTASLQAGLAARDIEKARRQADVVVVLAQWGEEYSVNPTQRQQQLASEAIEQGATLIIGNHPHVVQAVEWQGEAFVAYALGNFVFDQDWSIETQQGAVLEATFIGSRLASVRLLPVRIVDMHQATWAAPQEARSILDRMRRASEAIAD